MKRKLALTLILTLFMTGCGEVATVADAESTTATESGSTEETTEELASAMAQADLTATPSPAPTASPIPTPEPEPATRTISPDYSVTDLSVTMYAKSTVNVRSLPDTTGDKLGSLKTNEEVTVTGKCNETGWYEIAYGDSTAYVSDAYLVSEKATTTVASTGGTGSAGRSAGSAGNVERIYIDDDILNRIISKVAMYGLPGWDPSEICNEECAVKGMTYGEIADLMFADVLWYTSEKTGENTGVPSSNAGTAVASGSGLSASDRTVSADAEFRRSWGEQVLALVNAERASAGLGELVWDEGLYDIAMQRCYENDGHASMREGTSENCFTGAAGSAQDIHNAWYKSQGHHDNYMKDKYNKGAVAVYYNGYSLVAYEVFQADSDWTEWVDRNTGEVNTAPVNVTSGTLTWYHECDQGWDAMCPLCNPDGWREAQEAYYAQ